MRLSFALAYGKYAQRKFGMSGVVLRERARSLGGRRRGPWLQAQMPSGTKTVGKRLGGEPRASSEEVAPLDRCVVTRLVSTTARPKWCRTGGQRNEAI
jgi:hypothetical protein